MNRFIVYQHQQGSDEWLQARCGIATASNFSDIVAKGKGVCRRNYLLRIVGERLSGTPNIGFKNLHTNRGHEHEPISCMSYELATNYIVSAVGFIRLVDIDAGSSPDGLVNDDGGIEMKNVIPSVQVETWERGGYPPEHKAQIMGNLWITGRKWWDFVSHSETIKDEKLRTYIFRVERDEEYIANLEDEVKRFMAEVNVTIADLKRKVA